MRRKKRIIELLAVLYFSSSPFCFCEFTLLLCPMKGPLHGSQRMLIMRHIIHARELAGRDLYV